MFLAPLFLLGLLAIGMPIWLHRVARANPVRYPFPSLMLLEPSQTERTAHRTLRYWLLLLLRILLIAALTLAFAGPLWRKDDDNVLAASTRLHAIVLDASLSMQYGERWRDAIDAVESVLARLRTSDQVMLVRASGRRMDIVQEPLPAREVGTLRARLTTLTPGRERLDFGAVMSSAEQWLRTPRPPVVLHFVSDFQRTGSPLRFADLEPPAGAQLVIHDVSGDTRDNVYIDRMTLSEGDTRVLHVAVRSTSSEPQRREVVLSIDGKEHARRSVQLPAWTPTQQVQVRGEGGVFALSDAIEPQERTGAEAVERVVVFDELALAPGAHRIEARLEPNDALVDDDHYYAVIEHADPQALLLTANADADEAVYFAAAIGALNAPRVRIVRESAGSFAPDRRLEDYAIVVVPDIFSLSSRMAARLEAYLTAGGTLLATLGPGSSNAAHPLLPSWRMEKPRARLERIGAVDASHPVLREAAEWHGVRIFRQRIVHLADDDRVLIAHSDGTPLLVERALGAGRMLVMTAPIDRQWNDLAIHPVFVQFIAQATQYLIGRDSSVASVAVGTPVTTGLTQEMGGQIFDPNGKRVLELAAIANAERLLPSEIGFYEIRRAHGTRWLAVNTDRRESDLEPLSADYLARWQALRQRPARPEHSAAPSTAERSERQSLGPSILWIAALLLLAELILANRHLAVRREVRP